MAEALGNPIEQVTDGENNAVEFDAAYPLRGDPASALRQLRAKHGDAIHLLPMSATSSGGGIFQHRDKPDGCVIGLRFDAPLKPRLRFAAGAKLERIEQDDYGFCDACGVEIGIKRLEARPTATLCIDCKTLDEIKEKQELG